MVWGIPYLLIKIAVHEVAPASLVLLRTAIGTALLLPVVVRRGRLREIGPRWPWVVLFALVEVAGPWFVLSDAERRISSSLAGLLIASVPFVGALLARLLGGAERLTGRRALGLAVGLAGVAVLVGFDVGADDLVAVGEVGLCVLGYALGPIIAARRLSGLPGPELTLASLGLCAVLYLPLGVAGLGALPSAGALAAVAVLGAVCTALAFLLFFALIEEVGALRATVITYVNPAVAVAAGVAVLGEPFTLATGAGFALVLGGSFLATRG